jgi:hypothetical protein
MFRPALTALRTLVPHRLCSTRCVILSPGSFPPRWSMVLCFFSSGNHFFKVVSSCHFQSRSTTATKKDSMQIVHQEGALLWRVSSLHPMLIRPHPQRGFSLAKCSPLSDVPSLEATGEMLAFTGDLVCSRQGRKVGHAIPRLGVRIRSGKMGKVKGTAVGPAGPH